MKDCTKCKHAVWDRTANGRLHPNGFGDCQMAKLWKAPPLPACCYWLSAPEPCGGHIDRRRELKEHCTYYARETD